MQHLQKGLATATLALVFAACSPAVVSEPATAHEANGAAASSNTVPNATSGTYRLERTHASLTWKVMHKGLAKYTARFVDFDATLQFDANDPQKSTLEVSIDPTSVRTDYPTGKDYKFAQDEDFDAALAGKDWFNAPKFSAITFTATGIERNGDNAGHVTGDLTFLGVTKSVTLDVVLNGAKSNPDKNTGALGFSATTSFNRSEFGLTRYIPVIGDQIEINLEVEFYLDNES
ncbi:MAG: polyisoprenoid-binding protein [Robiginitomaculum sp.]|nr:MAG: polyisoprenoid-binding protein [Robiginitomaculum sp.]